MSTYTTDIAQWVGGSMIRISIPFFYGLGSALHALQGVKADDKPIDTWIAILNAQKEINGLFSGEWFMPAIKSAFTPGNKLLEVLNPLAQRADFAAPYTEYEIVTMKGALREFETVLKSELAISDSYFVTRKGGYDTSVLISVAERCFPQSLVQKVPQAIIDIREGGKCLAFELNTAAGFHILRATETVLRAYWAAISKGKPHPAQRNIGVYLKKMETAKLGSKKVIATLQQIKDLHRNPLMHPEEMLTLDEAASLFGICQSAISAMLNEIPEPTSSSAGS